MFFRAAGEAPPPPAPRAEGGGHDAGAVQHDGAMQRGGAAQRDNGAVQRDNGAVQRDNGAAQKGYWYDTGHRRAHGHHRCGHR